MPVLWIFSPCGHGLIRPREVPAIHGRVFYFSIKRTDQRSLILPGITKSSSALGGILKSVSEDDLRMVFGLGIQDGFDFLA